MEKIYLELVEKILEEGLVCENRTGVSTRSLMGVSMRWDLSDGTVPLLTTRRIPWKVVLSELLWFIRGGTNSKELERQGVNIWKDNSTRDFLDGRGLEWEEGELGPIYGFQWRHFGASYPSREGGVDQLTECLRLIREDPTSRRIILTAWNPLDIEKMALPPCHLLCQFLVRGDRLNCVLYQRSGDVGLGIPFNIASYATLTHIMARLAGLRAGELVHFIADAHIYENHEEPLRVQLTREPREFPRLRLREIASLDEITLSDMELIGYDPHPPITMKMVV